MAIDTVAAMLDIPGESSAEIRPPMGESWRVSSPGAANVSASFYDGSSTVVVAATGSALEPIIITNDLRLRIDNSSTGARKYAYSGVKL